MVPSEFAPGRRATTAGRPMPAPTRAHLLLPSPQGLVHYDLLEETAFLGPAARGGLHASPSPFREAKVVLTDDGTGFVVRALPGEAPPDVNGTAADGSRLRDGDRVRLGDQVALFRTSLAPAAVPAPAPVPLAAPRARRAPTAAAPPPGARQGARALGIAGALVLLLAAYRAVQLMQAPPPARLPVITTAMTTPREVVVPRAEEQAAKAFEEAAAFEKGNPGDVEGIVARYAAVARAHRDTAAGLRAEAEVLRNRDRLAAKVWSDVAPQVDADVRGGRYRRALAALDQFETRFLGTPAAAEVPARRETARTGARAALDGLRQRVAPLLSTDPTRAYRVLTTSGLELPPDLDAELAALMARVRETWGTPPPPKEGPPAPGTGRAPPDGRTGFRPLPTPTEPGAPTPSVPPSEADAAARALWAEGLAHLKAGRWDDARSAYARLWKEQRNAACVVAHPERVKAGRLAADLGLHGPAALLTGTADWKDGRLAAEYRFDDAKAFQQDFTVEQPFAGDASAEADVREGMAILSGSTSMMLKIVFDPSDVTWEIDGVADEPRDYGVVGFQEGREYRAVAMHVGNTQFRLKKGAAATVLPGHVLWLFGDGVWKDADPGERGFVRIAVDNANKLKGGERATVRCTIHDGRIEGDILSKSDKVRLQGALKGDDGRGIGPLRVGAFAYNGRVGVERFRAEGKVDAAWWKAQMAAALSSALGPD
jgi:hypothetical protein